MINEILEKHFERCPNLVSLDVEGMDYEILDSFDFPEIQAGGFCLITLKLVPVAMNYASIADGTGDGLAENVTILFSRSVDALHAPDQVSVIFGSAEPETRTKAYTWNVD